MYEVEIKAKAKQGTLERIQALGVKIKEICQLDTYYSHPSRDFRRTDEALRIRRDEAGFTLTYKGPRVDEVTKTRLERNIPVTQEAHQLLEDLDFRKVIVIEKHRRKYEAGSIGIFYDNVKGLGQYVELETSARQKEEIDAAREDLFSLFAKLGFSRQDSITKSYLELLQEKQAKSTGSAIAHR